MVTIEKECTNIYVINKSKFISFAYPVDCEEECKNLISLCKSKYKDATHVCYAYLLASPRVEKCSDDGEPSGTAGKPILELIKKKKIQNILIIVVRYFGGKKLGAGGLIRAYTTSANLVLDNVINVEPKSTQRFLTEVDLESRNKVLNYIKIKGGKLIKIEYGEKVKIIFELDEKETINFEYTLEKVGK